MALKLGNLASSLVNDATITASSTSFVVGNISGFPVIGASGNHFHAILRYADGVSVSSPYNASDTELIKVTGITGNAMTAVRGQGGTTAKAFDASGGDKLELTHVVTAEDMEVLTGIVRGEYEGVSGSKLGVNAAGKGIGEVNADLLRVRDGGGGLKMPGTGGEKTIRIDGDNNANADIIIPAPGTATNQKTLARLSDLAGAFPPFISGSKQHTAAASYPAVGGEYGDCVGIVEWGTDCVLASPFAALLDPAQGTTSVITQSGSNYQLGSISLSNFQKQAGFDGVYWVKFTAPAGHTPDTIHAAIKAIADDTNNSRGKLTGTGNMASAWLGAQGIFGGLHLWQGHSVRGIQQPPVYVASDNASPAATDDAKKGFLIGSRWLTANGIKEFICLSNTVGAASWKQTRGAIEELWSGSETSGTHSLSSGKSFADWQVLSFVVDSTLYPGNGTTSNFVLKDVFYADKIGIDNVRGLVVVQKESDTQFSIPYVNEFYLKQIYGIF